MVKNNTGGKSTKSKARKNTNQYEKSNMKDLLKTEDQDYAKILNVYGGGRSKVKCYSVSTEYPNELLAICRGKLNQRSKCKIGQLVCISFRDYEKDKCDIIYVNTTRRSIILFRIS